MIELPVLIENIIEIVNVAIEMMLVFLYFSLLSKAKVNKAVLYLSYLLSTVILSATVLLTDNILVYLITTIILISSMSFICYDDSIRHKIFWNILFLLIIIIISLLVTAGTFVLSKYHNRDKMMTQMNKDIQDYYYISCPNGNELDIKQKSSNEYQYSILSYPFSTTEYTNKFTFRLKVSLDQKFIFEKIGLLTGTSGVNANTDFPNCLIKENDSSQYQRFFLPTPEEDNDVSTILGEGKIYVSFKNAINSSDISSVIDEYSEYGTVTWLWVDTYNDSDSTLPTIQNPQNDERGVYGIPLFYAGEKLISPLDKFVNIINDKHAYLEDEFENIRNGINTGKDTIKQSDINIIGIVLLSQKDLNRSAIINEIAIKGNVYVVN